MENVLYQVYDNDKLADCRNHKVHASWHTASYETLSQAQAYVRKWFYPYICHDLQVGEIVAYSGAGDTAEIRVLQFPN